VLLNKHRATGMILCSEDSCVRKESHSASLAVCRFIVLCSGYIAVCIESRLLSILRVLCCLY